jgi:transposase InsO family protein
MPFAEKSVMSLREEFVRLALAADANVRDLCGRFGVSAPTAYKWMERYQAQGRAGLADRSRRPHGSPGRIAPALETQIVTLRDAHPAWGARKLRRRLIDLQVAVVPSASTITQVLRRNGRLDAAAAPPRAFVRFEHAAPNDLWQMDFKGHFALRRGRCHPLTVLDDHSRFALGLEACGDERWTTVQARLTSLFRRYGMPWRMLADNGSPWGTDADTAHTLLTVWLLRLGIPVSHGRPYHPQTQGKAERFHRSLTAELLTRQPLSDLDQCQRCFDAWRQIYNAQRPHEALGLQVPLARYRPSARTFPETLPTIEYHQADVVRTVDSEGRISFRNQALRISKAFRGHRVALRPTDKDGQFEVCFGDHPIAGLDLKETKSDV